MSSSPPRKLALITGGNTGIGLATITSLAKTKEYDIVMAVRNIDKGNVAINQVKSALGGTLPVVITPMQLDLSSLNSVSSFASKFNSTYNHLELLLLNAGVWLDNNYQLSPDGHELTFQTNHLSQFYLVKLLLPLLRSSNARIVVTASALHSSPSQEFKPGHWELSKKEYDARKAYNNSKLANVLFAYQLQRLESENGITTNVIHPGFIPTSDLFRASKMVSGFLNYIVKPVGRMAGFVQTLQDGANANLTAANWKEGGLYFDVTKVKESSEKSRNVEWQQQLWKDSEEMIRKFEEGQE